MKKEDLFILNPDYLKGLSFERHHAHEVITSMSNCKPHETKTLFDIYFSYVFSKRSQGFFYDCRLEKLMHQIELSWIRENVPVNEFVR